MLAATTLCIGYEYNLGTVTKQVRGKEVNETQSEISPWPSVT